MDGAGPDPLAYGWLVRALARYYRGRGLEPEDLVQEGFLGLLRACRRYDGRGGTPFEAYARLLIRRSIRQALIDQAFPVRVPSHLHRLRRRLRLRGGPAAGLTPARAGLLAAAAPHWGPAPDAPPPDGPAVAPEPDHADPWELDRLRQALAALPPRERRVIGLRHGLDGRPPLLLRQAAAELGATKQWMHRLERRALRRLRLALDPDADADPDTTG